MAIEGEYPFQIRGLTYEGVGVARGDQNEKLHIYGAIPGETGQAVVTGKMKGQVYGVPVSFSRAHPEREEPFCSAFERCLGCPTMPFPEEVQQSLRAHLLERILHRITKERGTAWPNVNWVLPTRVQRWARKVRYRYRVSATGEVQLGFYRPDQTTIENLDDCAVAAEPLVQLLPYLRDCLGRFSLPSTGQIVAAMDDLEDCSDAVLCLRAEDKHFPDPDWCAELASGDWPVRGVRLIDREFRERFRSGDPTYVLLRGNGVPQDIRATVGLPIEDDPLVLGASTEIVRAWLDAYSDIHRVLELFAGVGVFTAHLHQLAERVDAVTNPAHALDDLHSNFDAFPKDRIQRAYASLSRGLGYAFRKKDRYDLVCAWVPMRGAIGLWRTLADVGSSRLITSHAALESAGPDLRRILDLNYHPEEIHAFAAEPSRGRVSILIRWRGFEARNTKV